MAIRLPQPGCCCPKCELQIAAVQAVNGYLPFDYDSGEIGVRPPAEVTGLYMIKVIKKEWNFLGEGECGDGYHWAKLTTKIHRKFDDSGTPYYQSLETSCSGVVRSYQLNDDGTESIYYNPAVYLEDQNDDGSPNPGNWGLNTAGQKCIVWIGGVPLTDSRVQGIGGTGTGYDTTVPRCGEGRATYTDTTPSPTTVRVTTTRQTLGDAVTSQYTETLSDWYPKETDWKTTALELLAKRNFDRWTFTDRDDDVEKVFGCELSDTQKMTLYWQRGEVNSVAAVEGLIPDTSALIAALIELTDWSGGSPDDAGSDATFVSGSAGDPPNGIFMKKSRRNNADCEEFIEQVFDALTGGFAFDPAVCINPGPFVGLHDFIPDLTFGYTNTDTCTAPGC